MLDAFDDGDQGGSDSPPWAVPGGIEPQRPARRPARGDSPRSGPGAGPGAGPRQVVTADRENEPEPGLPPRRAGRPGRSRAAQARRRRSKRRLVTLGGTVLLIVVLVLGGWYVFARSPAPKSPYVTTLQKGEIQHVPNACKVIGATALHQYLAGTPAMVQPYNDPGQSQCSYTVDAKPTFRELNIKVQAYSPSLTVPVGNGSATSSATYTFAQQRQALAKPPKNTPEPPATISSVSGLGDQALAAVQVFKVSTVTEQVTVLIRYRNVLVTVYMEGQASGGFGPLSVGTLRSGAMAVARAVLAAVKQEPAVG